MDGGALVKLARRWKTVPEQHICTYEYKLAAPKYDKLNTLWKLGRD